MRYYAGIGSRKTPVDVCNLMKALASHLERKGWKARSGGADRADCAFDDGVRDKSMVDVYLPWQGFNNHSSELYLENLPGQAVDQAYQIACKFYHSYLPSKSKNVRALMTRNTFQIFGHEFNKPSKFVICYTEDGEASGGTGQAIKIARAYYIPVINLQKKTHREMVLRYINELC